MTRLVRCAMRRLAVPVGAALGFLACGLSTPARAEHAKINLDVSASGAQQVAFVDQTPPEWGKSPRPVLKVKAGDPIRIQWTLTNVYPHKTLENVVVHFFIVAEKKVGQKELPESRGDVVIESAFDMDFKPGSKA